MQFINLEIYIYPKNSISTHLFLLKQTKLKAILLQKYLLLIYRNITIFKNLPYPEECTSLEKEL